ncbi:MAG: hypothetical protein GOMPHAMPRED_003432 [Gomphillus americanus]|uniref:C2H2-type domain-containing protein n=1 Tax=Gomphillus americanus TaxID=1940652 RepID=A0A8H3IK03_9LECA|nr:MAG: hypothetical protein GOMPHAMPRED_003432 [Gomphillus americanus]
MADSKSNAYGTNTSDTSFRKTWDKAEYTEKARAREAQEREEGKARYEAKLQGKKYYKSSDTTTAKQTESRANRLNVAANVGKTMLVPAGVAAVGKRGRGAGFYCADCDLTFKDNIQLVDHLNSKQHLTNVGESGEVGRATLEEVRARLEYLKQKREEDRKELNLVDLQERIKRREDEEETKREEKRRKRREKRRKTEGGVGHNVEEDEESGIIC